MSYNPLQEFTTERLLDELAGRGEWFYTWTPETIKVDHWSHGVESPTDDECDKLCELIYDRIDDEFFDMTQALLHQLRLEGTE